MSIAEEWMKKMLWDFIQTVSFAGKSTELEMFMLKKRMQTQKDKHCTCLSHAKPRCKCADVCV